MHRTDPILLPHVEITLALQNVLTSSKVRLNPIGWQSHLTKWQKLTTTQTLLISDICACQQLKEYTLAVSSPCSGATVILHFTDLLLITHNSMRLGHSCPASTASHSRCSPAVSATLVVIMLPRIGSSVPKAQLAQCRGRRGILSTVCVCRSVCSHSLHNIKYQYRLQLSARHRNDGLNLSFWWINVKI